MLAFERAGRRVAVSTTTSLAVTWGRGRVHHALGLAHGRQDMWLAGIVAIGGTGVFDDAPD